MEQMGGPGHRGPTFCEEEDKFLDRKRAYDYIPPLLSGQLSVRRSLRPRAQACLWVFEN